MSANRPIQIIVNPAAGNHKGPEFVNSHVIPILNHFDLSFELHTTIAPGHAGELGRQILAQQESQEIITCIIVGGDGTTHELIESVMAISSNNNTKRMVKWEIIILPFGTANALYHSLYPPGTPNPNTSFLSSLPDSVTDEVISNILPLHAYLTKSGKVVPLPITFTTHSSSCKSITSHIVLSTALHAVILDSSEALRESHPGPERFKIAAQENISMFFNATARLFGSLKQKEEGLDVEQWDPRTEKWTRPYTAEKEIEVDGVKGWELEGPFSYFLSTSTVDRLEPTFVISPHTSLRASSLGSPAAYIYLVVLRPLRDPLVASASDPEKSQLWAKRAMEVLSQAYHEGQHISLTYPHSSTTTSQESTMAEKRGNGPPVIEYFRLGFFEWIPNSSTSNTSGSSGSEEKTRLICADGAIHRLQKGEKAKVHVRVPDEGNLFHVWI
ncbi:uncharacterized protein L203_103246 [Cryptococcus depauperatus CBS 7841]|uniref:Uncharacterized protein n=1 Tax=Cryptococcus depauperatus CBS 7841 TaxID=1295531 RepID=A0A1E3HR96_9TREE|nr:hypothetical protein L203_06138 [Cryptococcus depauperatus CBS 7841]